MKTSHIVWHNLYETSRISKAIEKESKFVVGRDWGEEEMENDYEYRVSYENLQESVVMDVQLCKYTKKLLNCILQKGEFCGM